MRTLMLIIILFFICGCKSSDIDLDSNFGVEDETSNIIYVELKGKVRFPGIYEVSSDKYLYEIWPNATNAQVGKMYTDDTGLDDWGAIPAVWK